jgi:hypothetical protein
VRRVVRPGDGDDDQIRAVATHPLGEGHKMVRCLSRDDRIGLSNFSGEVPPGELMCRGRIDDETPDPQT